MWTCKEICRRIASDEYAEASGWERLLVRFHLWRCQHCRSYETQLRTIGASTRELFLESPPASADLERLERRIVGSAAGAGDASVDSNGNR